MFKFRHESQITIRDYELKESQAELAKAHNARRILDELFQEVERQLMEGTASARNMMQEGQTVNVNHLLGLRRQEMFLRAQQEELTQKIRIVDEEIEIRRIRVLKASQALKSVQKLKEKHYDMYLEEENRDEAKFMDEIAGNVAARK